MRRVLEFTANDVSTLFIITFNAVPIFPETLMFNGYQEEVAHMYKDMDLSVDF